MVHTGYAPSQMPSAIQTLNSPAEFRNFDLSGMGAGNDCDENSSLTCEADDTVPAVSAVTETSRDEPISVIGLSQKHFKTKLVNHLTFCSGRIR